MAKKDFGNRSDYSQDDLEHEKEMTDAEPELFSLSEMYAIDEPDPAFENGVLKHERLEDHE